MYFLPTSLLLGIQASPAATSSAGVFDSTGALVRTLWSAVPNNPNVSNPAAAWDGRLDDFSTAPAGVYTVKLLQSNVTYTWEGVIGNSSPNHVNNLQYHTYGTTMADMTLTDGSHSPPGVGTEIYFMHQYDERFSTRHVTTENNIQQANYVLEVAFRAPYISAVAMCTDSITVYMLTFGGANGSWVHAVICNSGQIANNAGYKTRFNFSSGVFDPTANVFSSTTGACAFTAAVWSNSTPYGVGNMVAGSNGILYKAITNNVGHDPTTDGGANWFNFGVSNNHILATLWDIAVQKSGNFLFVSQTESTGPTVYGILTVNKTTGAAVHDNVTGFNTQRSIATNPVTGELWVTHSSGADNTAIDTITKMTADGGGVLTATGVAITGLSGVINLEVSPDGSMLLVTDGGSSQQVKAFNTSDGSVKTTWGNSGTLGSLGGYAGSPAVTNTKFMFSGPQSIGFGQPKCGFVAFSSDGSFWIGDGGNYRYLHFSSGNNPTYIEQIAYFPGFYSVVQCRNDPTRIFGNYLEFKIDYSKPLAYGNGSWTLANNWAAGVPLDAGGNPFYNQYQSIKWPGVYSNGRTYALMNNPLTGWEPVELTTSGLRLTGLIVSDTTGIYLDYNFNVWFCDPSNGPGSPAVFQKDTFTGFDGSNNPTWALPADDQEGIFVPPFTPWPTVLTTPVLPALFPPILGDQAVNSPMTDALSNGIIPVFNRFSQDALRGSGNHLGGLDAVTGAVKFSVHPSAPPNHGIFFEPQLDMEIPFFDVDWEANPLMPPGAGTGVGDNGGGSMFYLPGGSDIFTQYPGESWGSNQSNYISHWHETGLLIGRFGMGAPYFGGGFLGAPKETDATTDYTSLVNVGDPSILPISSPYSFKGMAGLAGNAFNGGITLVNGKYYVYHNDEWYHAGIHRWRVDGLSTVVISNQTVTWGGIYTPPTPNPYDMLAGLPYSTNNLPNNTAGWVRNPTADVGTNFTSGPYFSVRTNAITCDPFKSPDICFVGAVPATQCTLQKTLTRNNTGNWSLNAVAFLNFANVGAYNIYILDGSGNRIIGVHNGLLTGTSAFSMIVNDNLTTGIGAQAVIPLGPGPTTPPSWGTYTSNPIPLIIAGNVSTGKLTVTYGKYTLSNISVMDVGADIVHPHTFQILLPAGNNLQAACFTQLMFNE